MLKNAEEKTIIIRYFFIFKNVYAVEHFRFVLYINTIISYNTVDNTFQISFSTFI